MSTRSTGMGVMTTLRQIVYNLDSQRDQLTAAIERDYPTGTPEHDRTHRDLANVFLEIAHARESLVDAHNQLRDVVAPIDLARPRS